MGFGRLIDNTESMMYGKPVSVIIVSYNDRMIMHRCLEALYAQLDVAGDEIIVVDNGSTDGVLDDLRRGAEETVKSSSTDALRRSGPNTEGVIDLDSEAAFDRRRAVPLKLIENGENAGFPVGCNIGFEAAALGNDIFLLNNDAVLSDGAMENLRRALYSAEDIGAVGAASNNALEQNEPGIARNAPLEEALRFGAELGARLDAEFKVRFGTELGALPDDRHLMYEYRSRLTGFAVLLKRSVVDRLVSEDGYFLDPRFSPGYFEDEDLGVRVALAGYRQILCHDAFIYHKGGTGFASHPEAMERGRQKFIDKWGFDIWVYIGILDEYEQVVEEYCRLYAGTTENKDGRQSPDAVIVDDKDGQQSPDVEIADERRIDTKIHLRILELDCGMGVNLAHLQYLYPGSIVIGIEHEPFLARIAAQLIDVICADNDEAVRCALIPGTQESEFLTPGTFDIIFAWDALERSDDEKGLRAGLQALLKPGGRLVFS